MSFREKANFEMPIYVTNKYHNGQQGIFTINIWVGLLIFYLALFNLLGWSIYGAVQLVDKVI